MHPDGVNLKNIELGLFDNRIHILKYLRSTTLGCKDIGIRKRLAKTQFLCKKYSNFDENKMVEFYEWIMIPVVGG